MLLLKLINKRAFCTATKTVKVNPSKGFLAVDNPTIRKQISSFANASKVDALAQVISTLNDKQLEYLSLLVTSNLKESTGSQLSSKLIARHGQIISPLQHFYQKQWAKKHWKQSNLLNFVVSSQDQEEGDKEVVEAVKEIYDVELTSIEATQKIKIIKVLRDMLGLGLKEAKDFADKVPSILKKNIKKEQAQKLKKDLQGSGCVITLK